MGFAAYFLKAAFVCLSNCTATPQDAQSETAQRHWKPDALSPFEQNRVLTPVPNHAKTEQLRREFAKRFPQLGKPKLTHTWAGMIDAMPDLVPIVDRVPQIG